MSYDLTASEADQHPAKKRRFFAQSSPAPPPEIEQETPDVGYTIESETHVTPNGVSNVASSINTPEARQQDENLPDQAIDTSASDVKLDVEFFTSIIGEQLPQHDLRYLDEISGGNMERAMNMYFDGSWKLSRPKSPDPIATRTAAFGSLSFEGKRKIKVDNKSPAKIAELSISDDDDEYTRAVELDGMPDARYIGCFGVEGWATRSGRLLSHGEAVRIERQKMQGVVKPVRRGKGKSKTVVPVVAPPQSKTKDLVVRFTNSKGEEVGRLPQEAALFVSTLLDQKVCTFKAVCVYAPDFLRTNDTVYLQLESYLLKDALERRLLRPADSNRAVSIFEAKETVEERDLRLRQTSLVKLFDEIKLHPLRSASDQKRKKEGLLQAAEMAEEKAKNGDTTPSENKGDGDEKEEGQELEQDQLDQLYRKAQAFDFDSPEAEPTDTFVLDLRRYQKQALHWMLGKEKDQKNKNKDESMHPLWEEYSWPTKDQNDQELAQVPGCDKFYVNPYSGEISLKFPVQEQNCLGGVLADEMGLGKTIEMLSLIHSHRPEIAPRGPQTSMNLPRLPKSNSTVEPAPHTTLVVAPMSLLAQWQAEAEKSSKPGSLKSIVYYGSDKSIDLRAQCTGANAINAPNLIITSYGTVMSEFNQITTSGNRTTGGGLFSIEFFRIILDEAHTIKNRTSKTAKACYELDAVHRWVLTGTPIVNRLEDLFSLVRFLRVEPWSNFSFWRTFITVPFESKDFLRALDVVQTVLEPLVMRRTKDMKQPDGTPLVPLPPKTIIIEEIVLSKPEREVYDFIFNYVRRSFAANIEAGTAMKSYTTLFAQILRLRQCCDSPILVRKKAILEDEQDVEAAEKEAGGLADSLDLQELIQRFTNEDDETEINNYGAHALQQIQEEAENECPICSAEPIEDQTVTGCFHMACKGCLLDHIEFQKSHHQDLRCFNCREPINEKELYEVVRHEDDSGHQAFKENIPEISLRRLNTNKSSAKIDALLTCLKKLRREKPGTKSVVFSQFTSFLDLLEPALTRDRFAFLRFDGTVTQQQRAVVINKFKAHNGGIILLISLKAGGVGLNLTEAKRVFMMDPWWSFAVESQAIDRIHRFGQTSEVVVHRFIVKDSVEERMVHKIQERKKFIASSLGMMNDEEKRAARIEDIKDLLS